MTYKQREIDVERADVFRDGTRYFVTKIDGKDQWTTPLCDGMHAALEIGKALIDANEV